MFFSSSSSYRAHRGGADYSEDSDRLPAGMQRCGYDADTQRYTFRDTANGALWEGGAGVVYGRMTRVGGGGGGREQVPMIPVRRSSRREEGEEGRDDGEVAVLGFEGVVRAVWEVVLDAPRRETEKKGGQRGRRRSTPGFVRSLRLDALRRPRGSVGLGRVASVDAVEGKEVRLALVAAGEKRTIFDVV